MKTAIAWNGPVCQTCGKGYLGTHECAPADLLRRAADLIEQAGQASMPAAAEGRMAHCPCRPENGGSGICGCVMGGMQITCSIDGEQIVKSIKKYNRQSSAGI